MATPVDPKLVELSPQSTLTTRLTVLLPEMGAKLSEAFSTVHDYATSHGAELTGGPFVRYHAHDEAAHSFEVEAGYPVAAPVSGEGEVASSSLPGGRAASLLHVGPYQELGASHWALQGWVQREGHQPSGGPWEVYITNPHEEPDSSKWETLLYLPLQD